MAMYLRSVAGFLLLSSVLIGCDLPTRDSQVVLPDPESAGAGILRENCSDCHAPPSPAIHTAAEWPNIIYRMQERRRMKGYSVMSSEEEETLLSYLQRHAKS